MAKSKLLLLVILVVMIYTPSIQAQTKASKAQLEEQAYGYLNSGDYANAYIAFDKLNATYPKEYEYKLRLGLCCLNYTDKNARAIDIFKEIKEKYGYPDSDYYLGKAYQTNYRFDEALAILEPLIKRLADSKKPLDIAMVEDATLGVANCKNGKYLIENKVFAVITNIGAPINTDELEGVPIINADESIMIFTYSGKKSLGGKLDANMNRDNDYGKYLLDIYKSNRKPDGTWNSPEPIKSLNTDGNDAAIGMSPDGQSLFVFYSDSKNSGDILVSKLVNNEFSKPVPMNANINTTEYWEGSCSVSADGRFFYFSSERPGGFGGRDIYVCEMLNGDWGPAVNLGPKINTKYDDDAPFIHPDGITMFFSSKGHVSIGGYDIMFSIKKENDWTEPKSMGIPLNTTSDDSFYVINSRGDIGYLSSDRAGSGGFGNLDIYMVTPGILGEKPIVALLKGMIYGDDKPIEAKIEVLKVSQNRNVGPYKSNVATGKYLYALSPGSSYHVKISAEGFVPVEDDIDLSTLSGYLEREKDYRLKSLEIVANTPTPIAAVDSTKKEVVSTEKTGTLVKNDDNKSAEPKTNTKVEKDSENSEKEPLAVDTPCTDILPDFGPVKGKSLRNESDYKRLLDVAGNYCSKNLLFKIQIGAFKSPSNFKYDNIKSLGKIEFESYPDGLTRFTQKQYKTLRDAERHRQKLIRKGYKDAWIVVFSDGKRYTLEDFVNLDFLGKTIN